jgi:hypothetical protein
MLTVTEAAKEIGITRGGLWKAIKAGRISATKDDTGQLCIDPVELFRVYPPVNRLENESRQQSVDESTGIQREVYELRLRLELTNRLLHRAESEVDDLRGRLDNESEERRKLMLLLTHKPEQVVNDSGSKEASKLWKKLFGRG